MHIDKVIGHQGTREKNCTRPERKTAKKDANWPFLCEKDDEH